ncbi:hypothetical protein CK203_005318 [Vitis vinifera]|uniref:Uncharacterized protein n=1 Tax=Vitis vinifera TaxID=29760 RepID=A0A438KFB1_VITVI|nr:hypothetical protein CK203_072907 [Vitis vinifera]RVX19892.1 hypothetical protein CK203_005318 [Vitis vinifera]
MESGDISRVVSGRIIASNILKNSSVEVFSRSSREEDDEEALKWETGSKL